MLSGYVTRHPVVGHICILSGCFFISWLVMCLIFPDVFVFHTVSFLRYQDAEHNYDGVLTLVSNFFHGGVQLWNGYDQMPLMYLYMIGNLTSFANLVTALVYIIFSPLFRFPGLAFQHLYSSIYYVPSMGIAGAGTYLLVGRFTTSTWIRRVATIAGATLYIPTVFLGLNSGSIYSFFPLMVHLILRFFETRRLTVLWMAILLFCVCMAMDLLLALGYFYQGIHFVLLGTIGWYVVQHKKQFWSLLWHRPKEESHWQWVKMLTICGLLGILLILPHAWLLVNTYQDYDFAHENSRFSVINPLDPTLYFRRGFETGPIQEFFYKMVDFEHEEFLRSFLFIGFALIFLSLSGAILSKDSRKYIFIFAAVSYYFLNTPKPMYSPTGYAHWLNALTNPLNFVVRSFHMTTAFQLTFLLVPLAVMGVEALRQRSKRARWETAIRVSGVFLLLLAYCTNVWPNLTVREQNYLSISMMIALAVVWMSFWSIRYRAHIVLSLILLLLVIDAGAYHVYYQQLANKVTMITHPVLDYPGPFYLDYQNPRVLPLRRYFDNQPIPHVVGYNKIDPDNQQGLLFRFTNLQKFFEPAYIYSPRHKNYANLAHDPVMQQYIQSQEELVFFADIATAEPGTLQKIVDDNDQHHIITVDRPSVDAGWYVPTLEEAQTIVSNRTHVVMRQWKEKIWHLRDGEKIVHQGQAVYLFRLPETFPSYLTSGIFTQDRSLITVTVGEKELQPAQGELFLPYTYDVQHLMTDHLAIAIPLSVTEETLPVTLRAVATYTDEVTAVHTNHPDYVSMDYQSPADGWIVFHYPYDPKWHVKIDEQSVPTYRANSDFLAVPVRGGAHTVEISYWPDTWVRWFLGVSMMLIITVPVWIIGREVREEVHAF